MPHLYVCLIYRMRLLYFLGVGSIILYCSVLTFFPHFISLTTCHLKVWMIGIGFAVMFGSLFAKAWRICQLYRNKSVEIMIISDRDVWSVIGLVVLIEVIFLIIFSAASNVKVEEKTPDIYRPSKNFKGSSRSSFLFF